MTVAHVNGHIHMPRSEHRDAHNERRDAFSRLKVGQQVELNVLRGFEGGGFLVSLGSTQHVMDSSVPLAVGGRIRAVVVSVGDRLELRYVDASAPQSAPSEDRTPENAASTEAPPTLLATLETKYRITLASEDQALVQHAVSGATDPTAMALGGIYLAKVGAPISSEALHALHDAQRSPLVGIATGGVVRDVSTLVDGAAEGDQESISELGNVLGSALPASTSAAVLTSDSGAMDSGSSDSHGQDELARQLLNLQDGGSLAYGYGTLPVIVAGQLVELDLVVLQQRAGTANGSSPVRRLAMTLQTHSFGQLRIEANALDNRLIVNFTGQSPQGAQELATYRDEVSTLLARLGWNVEAIGYELDAQPATAARNIIDHVVSAGTVNLVV